MRNALDGDPKPWYSTDMITELNKIVVIARASQDRAYAELRQSRNLVQAMLDGEFTGSAQERKILILLAGVVDKFRYLRFGLAIVLTFIGLKMLAGAFGFHISTKISLVVVAVVLVGSVVASLLISHEGEKTITVDLPPDFDPPND